MCDQLLKRHPHHAESYAMKGLFLSNLNRREEGYEVIKAGLRENLRSHVCWHSLGVLHRADRNYEEAFKCYKNALKFDKDNGQALRDLAILQTQMRQYSALCETRYQLLVQRPALRVNWVFLALSYHLAGQAEDALSTLDIVFKCLPVDLSQKGALLEHQELCFYKSQILVESGKYPEALEAIGLKAMGGRILDLLRWCEQKASLLELLGKTEESLIIWNAILEQNPDHENALMRICQLDGSQSVADFYFRMHGQYPQSLLVKSRLISTATTEKLPSLIVEHIFPMISRGIPSALLLVRSLYKKSRNMPALKKVIEAAQASPLFSDGVAIVWRDLLLAQHYSLLSDVDKCIEYAEKPLLTNPNSPDFLFYYAKFMKRLGKIDEAADLMLRASSIDKSDRFLNSKATKYALRAGRIEEAKDLACLFVKKGDKTAQLQDLVEMQSNWFAYELGCALRSKGDLLGALNYFDQIKKHFGDFFDDQYDFHVYIWRKMTLCSYVCLLKHEDVINGHPYFTRAAFKAIECLLTLHNDVSGVTQSTLKMSLKSGPGESQAISFLDRALDYAQRLIAYISENSQAQVLASRVFVLHKDYALAVRSIFHAKRLGENVEDLLASLKKSVSTIEDRQRYVIESLLVRLGL